MKDKDLIVIFKSDEGEMGVKFFIHSTGLKEYTRILDVINYAQKQVVDAMLRLHGLSRTNPNENVVEFYNEAMDEFNVDLDKLREEDGR